MRDFIINLVACVSLVVALAPVVLFFASCLVKYWTRGSKKPWYAEKFQYLLFPFIRNHNGHRLYETDLFVTYLGINWCANAAVTFVFIATIASVPAYVLPWIGVLLCSVAALIFVPRWVLDIQNNLKFKKGDSVRLRELEEQLNELKRTSK